MLARTVVIEILYGRPASDARKVIYTAPPPPPPGHTTAPVNSAGGRLCEFEFPTCMARMMCESDGAAAWAAAARMGRHLEVGAGTIDHHRHPTPHKRASGPFMPRALHGQVRVVVLQRCCTEKTVQGSETCQHGPAVSDAAGARRTWIARPCTQITAVSPAGAPLATSGNVGGRSSRVSVQPSSAVQPAGPRSHTAPGGSGPAARGRSAQIGASEGTRVTFAATPLAALKASAAADRCSTRNGPLVELAGSIADQQSGPGCAHSRAFPGPLGSLLSWTAEARAVTNRISSCGTLAIQARRQHPALRPRPPPVASPITCWIAAKPEQCSSAILSTLARCRGYIYATPRVRPAA